MKNFMKKVQTILVLMFVASMGALDASYKEVGLISCQIDTVTGNRVFKNSETSVCTAFAQVRMPNVVTFVRDNFSFGSVRAFLNSPDARAHIQELCQKPGEHFKCFKNMDGGQLEYAWFNKARRQWQGVHVSFPEKHIPEIVHFLRNKITITMPSRVLEVAGLSSSQHAFLRAFSAKSTTIGHTVNISLALQGKAAIGASSTVLPKIASSVPTLASSTTASAQVAMVASNKLSILKMGCVGTAISFAGYGAYRAYRFAAQPQEASTTYFERARGVVQKYPYHTAGSVAIVVALGCTLYKHRDALARLMHSSALKTV